MYSSRLPKCLSHLETESESEKLKIHYLKGMANLHVKIFRDFAMSNKCSYHYTSKLNLECGFDQSQDHAIRL